MVGKPNTKCLICGKMVYRNPNLKNENVTCSKECASKLNIAKNRVSVECLSCGTMFSVKKSFIPLRPLCSKACKSKYAEDIKSAVVNMHKEGLYDKDIADKIGYSRVFVTKIINSITKKNRRIKIDNIELRQRISASNKGKRTGKSNHMFKGMAKFTNVARGLFSSISRQYMLKMNYTCEKCGKRGGDLNTHHIKLFSIILKEFLVLNKNITLEEFSNKILEYKDFIDEDNLILLCKDCHDKEHYS